MRALLFALILTTTATAQTIGSGVTLGSGVTVGINTPTGITFSPPAGTYTGSQSVVVTCPAGLTGFYTTLGTGNAASTEITGPITIAATSTLSVTCLRTGKVYQDTNLSSSFWKCVTASGGTFGSLTCQSGGGVGTNNPSNVAWTFGAPMVETLSTTHSTGETQGLFVNTQPGCADCTMLAEDKIVQPDQGSTYVANQEMDANINLTGYNQFHTASLQCNQQSGVNQWQYDNQQGSWHNFSPSFTFGCPLSTTQPTEVRWGIHWTNGDTSCGGYSTDHYDYIEVCVGGTCQTQNANTTLCGYTEPTWSQSVVIQDQIDLTNTTQSGANPTTSSRSVWHNNVTAGYHGTEQTATATYTIH